MTATQPGCSPIGQEADVGKDTLVLSIKLASGDFISELRMPIPVTDEECKHAVERWLDFMATGFRLSAERMDAVFGGAT